MTAIEPYRECPRWPTCSVNHCPLDPFQSEHLSHEQDKERKCPMRKSVRLRIGSKYPDLLPMLGLTRPEHAGAQRWANLTLEQRQTISQRGATALSKVNPQSKGNSTKTPPETTTKGQYHEGEAE